MKFEVGDKVRVRNDLVVNKIYGCAYFVSQMVGFKGKEFTIESVGNSNSEDNKYYTLKEVGFSWTDGMLEPAVVINIPSDDLLSFLEE